MPLSAQQWDVVYEQRDFPPFSDVLLQKLFDEYKFTGSALDIGCGTGNLAGRLAERGLTVTAIDLSPTAIEKARAAHSDVQFTTGDVFEHTGQYDTVFAKLVYALMPDRAKFLAKVKSLLNPGGYFVMSTPVMFPHYEYDTRYKSISVYVDKLPGELRAVFPMSKLADTSYQGQFDAIQTWVCS